MTNEEKLASKEFTYPLTTPIYTRIALIAQKLLMNETIHDVLSLKEGTETIIFTPIEKSYYDFGREVSFTFINPNKRNYFYLKLIPGKWIEIFYEPFQLTINDDHIQRYPDYLDSKNNNLVRVVSGKIRNSIVDQTSIRNINGLLTNLKFFELAKQNIIPLFLGIRNFSTSNTKTSFRIAEFGKLRKYFEYLNTSLELPDYESVKNFIDVLTFTKQSQVSIIKYNLINVFLEKGLFNMTSINFLGSRLIYECGIEKFKYQKHPGLNFVCKILEIANKVEGFVLNAEKSIFNSI